MDQGEYQKQLETKVDREDVNNLLKQIQQKIKGKVNKQEISAILQE